MTLFLAGGGPAQGPTQIVEAFCERARAHGGRIGIALLGSPEDSEAALSAYVSPITAAYPEAVIQPIWISDEGAQWPDDYENLGGLVVGGGLVPHYIEALMPHREAISTLVRRRVPYLGYGAGAMIVGKHVIAGGWRYEGRRIAPDVACEGTTDLDVREGLGLIGPAIETHADQQFTVVRAMAAIEASSITTVAAIDEDTCLVVEARSGRTSIEGAGRVTWVSASDQTFVVHHEPRRQQK